MRFNIFILLSVLFLLPSLAFASSPYTGVISQWNDLSGNGENLYQSNSNNQPTINYSGTNNAGYVTFNGTSTYMYTADSNFSRLLTTNNGETIFIVQSSSSNTQSSSIISFGGTSTSNRFNLYLPLSSNYIFDYGDATNNRISVATTSYTSLGSHIYTALAQSSVNQILRYDGNTIATGNSSDSVTNPSCALTVGVYYNCNSSINADYFNGNVNEIIFYGKALSSSDYQKIEGYLAWKWNLQNNLPSNHPYKNGVITALRGAGTTNDNGNTVFTAYDNGTSIGTISFNNGSSTAYSQLSVPLYLNAGDVLTLRCTTAGTISNVEINAEGTQQSF